MVQRMGYQEQLEATEQTLLAQAAVVKSQLELVMGAVERRDLDAAAEVIEKDDKVDDLYLETQTSLLNLIALQAPVASDLRLVSALIHSNMHVERMGDLCVNIAKFVRNRHAYPTDSPMVTRLGEMGVRAGEMLDMAMQAFADRSVDLAEQLPDKDGVINRLNRGMLDELKRYVDDEESFEWATNLVLVARYLERIGDHCVDIAEQLAFLVSGVFREFTDASHPEMTES